MVSKESTITNRHTAPGQRQPAIVITTLIPLILSSEPMLELSPTARMLLSQDPHAPDRGFSATAFSCMRQIRRHPIEFVRF